MMEQLIAEATECDFKVALAKKCQRLFQWDWWHLVFRYF